MLNLLKKALETDNIEAKNTLIQLAIMEVEEEERKVTVRDTFNNFKAKLPKVHIELPGKEKKKKEN